ncbi:MAG: ComF family protein [Candidatus Eisenbacteria bacterium]|nr:ComF family protein [Candidatus Eisenbacteria bacterium]
MDLVGPCARIGRALLAFVLPDACLVCGTPLEGGERDLCARCRLVLRPAAPRALPLPTLEGGEDAPRPETEFAAYALDFDGPARALVHALKYQGRRGVADTLAAIIGPLVANLPGAGVDAIVPVPLHPVRLRERGFNQTDLIAGGLARFAGAPVQTAWLRRARPTRTQTDLSRADRIRNVRGAFAAGRALQGTRLLLLDDVVTTGATLASAASALRRAGASCECFAVAGAKLVDKTPRGRL